MDNIVSDKKQYRILLTISVITTLILPLIVTSVCFAAYSKMPQNSYTALVNIILRVGAISGNAGTAVLIFSAVRYRFKLCIPFAVIAVVERMAAFAIELIEAKVEGIQISSVAYSAITIFIMSFMPLAYIGITRACSKHIKKEALVILAVFLGMTVAGIFVRILSAVLNYLLIQIPEGYIDPTSSRLSRVVISFLKSSFRSYLYIIAAYLILKLVFAHNRRQKSQKVLSIVKISAKKLWDATSK